MERSTAPRTRTAPQAIAYPRAREDSLMEPTKGRILVVDDHPRNVTILQKILGTHHSVATAASGEEALTIASKFAPDLVLLDIMMPGIDGYETCRRFRSTPSIAQ